MSKVGFLLRPSVNAANGAAVTRGAHHGLSLEHHRGAASDVAEILEKPVSQEMLNRDLARLAYVARDGTPRVVPIAFTWNGTEVVMCTSTNAPKLESLRRNPAVAFTIDTEVHPPKILLLRGEAVLDEVEGIPDEYLRMNGTYGMTPEQRVEWEAEVRSLYDSMVRIVVKPTWAKLIDFTRPCPRPSRSSFANGRNASKRRGGRRRTRRSHGQVPVGTSTTGARRRPSTTSRWTSGRRTRSRVSCRWYAVASVACRDQLHRRLAPPHDGGEAR